MSPSSNRLAISTMSLGRAWVHKLGPKLEMAAAHGYQGIELFYEDLEYHANDLFNSTKEPYLLQAAAHIRDLCHRLHLEIICLQPLMHFEGLVNISARNAAFERARLYFRLANVLHTDIVAIPSNFLGSEHTTGDRDVIVHDLRALADIAVTYGIRLVYEALAWGTHVDNWEGSWQIVQAVNRPNFGVCLDTFNIAARIYADPAAASGCTENAFAAIEASLRYMAESVDVKKVFYIQIVDAERLAAPLVDGHEFYNSDQPARMSWSRNCRLFYGEQNRGAYLPVKRIMETILREVGFSGWMSMELFNRSMADPSPSTPFEHAERGAIAWRKLQKDLQLPVVAPSLHSFESDERCRPRSVL